jgi:mannose-1-phosphate guanylyltransferase
MENNKRIAVIMAGGGDSYFWPYSNAEKAKTFSFIYGKDTLLQNTYKRLSNIFAKEDIYIVTLKKTYKLVMEQIPEISVENIFLEPSRRGTAPCLSLAAFLLKNKVPENTIITAFPVDHIITDQAKFAQSIELANETAQKFNVVVAIGLKPTRAETSYGYLQYDETPEGLESFFERGVRKGITFAEKPDIATAQRFIDCGDFLWNSGIYTMNMKTLLHKIDKYLYNYSDIFGKISLIYGQDGKETEIENLYKSMPKISLDNGILEKSDSVFVVKGDFDWTDLNNWDELYRISDKNTESNLLLGNVISIDNNNSFIASSDKMVAVVGLEDVIVINSEFGVLVCKRSESERVHEIMNYMKQNSINQ